MAQPRYKIIKPLGSGSFGKVYEVQDQQKSGKCALKVMNAPMSEREWTNLQREVNILLQLTDENIVKVHDTHLFLQRQNSTFSVPDSSTIPAVAISMELCECDLKFKLEERLAINDVWNRNIFQQLISGMTFLHSNNVIHRDLKPGNILLNGDKVKISDFGLAKSGDFTVAATQTFCGTLPYMAPEVKLRERYDKTADIYSLGVILIELYTPKGKFWEWMAKIHYQVQEPLLKEHHLTDDLSSLAIKMTGKVQSRPSCREIKSRIDSNNGPRDPQEADGLNQLTELATRMAIRANSRMVELVTELELKGVIKSSKVKEVMKLVDRGNYCRVNAYLDKAQAIAPGITISAPHMHGRTLELMKDHLKPYAKALDVGSGSGYLTACMALMVGRNGLTIGIDRDKHVVEISVNNIKSDRPGLIESGNVKIVHANGRIGYASEAPFDLIHVGGSAAEIPQALLDQLKEGGRLIMPVGPSDGNQFLMQIDKLSNGRIKKEAILGVVYGALSPINPSMEDLVKSLEENGAITSSKVKEVMKLIDRGNYCKGNAYLDKPQTIAPGITISAPHMHGRTLELLKDHLKPGAKVLDVGSGSGYLTACMASMVGRTGVAIGIDQDRPVVDISINNIKSDQPGLIESGNVKMVHGDGKRGYSSEKPFDVIHVGASAPQIPEALLDQLKRGGRMIMPIGSSLSQKLTIVDKHYDGSTTSKAVLGVMYGALA